MVEEENREFDGNHSRVVENFGGYFRFRGGYRASKCDLMTPQSEADKD